MATRVGFKKFFISTPYVEAMFQIWTRRLDIAYWRPESGHAVTPSDFIVLSNAASAVHWTDNYYDSDIV